jgi:cell division transport system permease protein
MAAWTFRFHRRALRQAWQHLRGNAVAHATTISVIILAMTIYSVFALLVTNAERLLVNWQGDYHMILFSKKDTAPRQIAGLRDRLMNHTMIESGSVVTVSPDAAMQRLKEMIGNEAALLGELEGNPLPYMFEFRLKPDSDDQIQQVAQEIAAWPDVDGVSHDRQWAQRLDSIVHVFQYAGHTFAFLLLAMVGLIIANTIKLTVSARRDEIDAMRLMGATSGFIKAPFVYEGMIEGFVGALCAVGVTGLIYLGSVEGINTLGQAFGISVSMKFLSVSRVVFLVTVGAFLGVTGALLSLSRFLRV